MPKGGARSRSGPAPTPTAIKRLEGSTVAESNPREPIPVKDAPQRPAALKGSAKREWDLIIPELRQLGILARCDRATLAGYAVSTGRFLDLTDQINAMGEWAFTSGGAIEVSRLTKLRKEAELSMLRFAQEFGLSPSARTRVAADAEKAENLDEDPGEAFFRERKLRLVSGGK